MSIDLSSLRLNVGEDTPVTLASNYRPPSWPPPADFPIVIDPTGAVVSRYGDPVWDFTSWARKPARLRFGVPSRKTGTFLSAANTELLRLLAAWWLWGPASGNVTTLLTRVNRIRPIFDLCSRESVSVAELWRFPRLMDAVSSLLPSSSASDLLPHLHLIYEHRQQLGFFIMDPTGLRRLSAALPTRVYQQTPYIPPRIWSYQVSRLRAFLDDFHAHRDRIEHCFDHCLGAYADYFGSLERAFVQRSSGRTRGPFSQKSRQDRFSDVAARFGIADLLCRWILVPPEALDKGGHGVRMLSSYFSMVGKVSVAYILNHTMMRIEEAWSLRCDCLVVEKDDRFGALYTICGPTTKTASDSDARWIASPSVESAVSASALVSRMRMAAAAADPGRTITDEEAKNPYLIAGSYEPWSHAQLSSQPTSVRHSYPSYKAVIHDYPGLLNINELRIGQDDLSAACAITPTLNRDTFKVGSVWPLAWHQLRRTGAVNLQAAGVSEASLQYQLKHYSRASSLYYGQGYSRIRLNERARALYVRTMYEALAPRLAELETDRFVSPHGVEHKENVLKLVAPRDHHQLTVAAKEGRVAWRETLLGVCTHRGPCEYGGVDHVSRCCGGHHTPPCADLLIDRAKVPALRRLSETISVRLLDAEEGSPYRKSLEAQMRAVETAIDVATS